MAVASACFKWVDMLETQFDKSWVELDSLLLQLEDDEDYGFLYTSGRRHATSLASCFSQLAHKATVVFQNNAKLEAELLHLREEVNSAAANVAQTGEEKQHLTKLLQSTLVENHRLKSGEQEEEASNVAEVEEEDPEGGDNGELVLKINKQRDDARLSDSESLSRLLDENKRLRGELLELESEMVGARLDNVYLDKELAGRIQQIQLLLASSTPPDIKEKMWGQIESEMCLQRSKTIAQMCKTKQEVRTRMKEDSRDVYSHSYHGKDSSNHSGQHQEVQESFDSILDVEGEEERRGKQIMILKNPADDLGMAILGGREHNLPIIISEIFPHSAVARANKVKAGDIILRVNGEDFSILTHTEAVNFLSSLRGQIIMDLQGAQVVSEDDPSNLDYRFYKIFDSNVTKPEQEVERVQISRSNSTSSLLDRHPGKAVMSASRDIVDLENGVSVSSNGEKDDIPSVHSSPRRDKSSDLIEQ